MADSLAVLQAYGSPDTASLVSLVTDNSEHVYTISANATTTSASITLNNTYSHYLVWLYYSISTTAHNIFMVANAGSTIYTYGSNQYLQLDSNKISIKSYSTAGSVSNATVLGII